MFSTKHNLVFTNFCTIFDVDLFDDGILVILRKFPPTRRWKRYMDVPGCNGVNRHYTNYSVHLQCFVAGLSLVAADDEKRKQHGEDTTAETDKVWRKSQILCNKLCAGIHYAVMLYYL